MDFLQSSYSSFPALASTDGWPTMENIFYPTTSEKAFTADQFIRPDAFLTVDTTQNLVSTSISDLTTEPQLRSSLTPPYDQTQFAQLEPFPVRFPFETNGPINTSDFDFNLSPLSDGSSGEIPQDAVTLASPPLSPRPEPPSEHCPAPPDPQKPKRGRPRLDRSAFPLNKRLPHNQVERKYREGINASLERLRKLIPSLCQNDKLSGLLDLPRPSKAMILEGAIEHIKEMEKERDLYRAESKRLRRTSELARSRKAVGTMGNGSCRARE